MYSNFLACKILKTDENFPIVIHIRPNPNEKYCIRNKQAQRYKYIVLYTKIWYTGKNHV